MTTRKKQNRKMLFVRIICVMLAVFLIGSSVAVIAGIF